MLSWSPICLGMQRTSTACRRLRRRAAYRSSRMPRRALAVQSGIAASGLARRSRDSQLRTRQGTVRGGGGALLASTDKWRSNVRRARSSRDSARLEPDSRPRRIQWVLGRPSVYALPSALAVASSRRDGLSSGGRTTRNVSGVRLAGCIGVRSGVVGPFCPPRATRESLDAAIVRAHAIWPRRSRSLRRVRRICAMRCATSLVGGGPRPHSES